MGRESADDRMSNRLYLAIVHAILLFEAYHWVAKLHTGRVLRIFHHKVAQLIMGNKLRIQDDWVWDYPPVGGGHAGDGIGGDEDIYTQA